MATKAPSKRPRSKGPYSSIGTSQSSKLVDSVTGSESRVYSLEDVIHLWIWLKERAAGYPVRRKDVYYA